MKINILKLIVFINVLFLTTCQLTAQNTFVDLILGDMYGKSKLEVYEYLKSFPIKNDTGAFDYTYLEALKEESMKADEIVCLGLNGNGLLYLDEKESDGICIYFYLGRAYRVTISGDWAWDSLLNELTARLGKGKIKKIKVEIMGVSFTNLYSWNTKDYKVEYHDGIAYPSSLEVIYKPIFTTIQKPVLKIFMRNGDFRPYQVEWSADSNNVTNGCSSLQRLELLGNVKNLSFVIQCLNGNEVFRKDIPQSKGKKVILTYNDLPEGCEPVITHVISPDENLYSTRYVFKLLEGEYEHFSGSLHLDDCRD
jgi:hypothetical protein